MYPFELHMATGAGVVLICSKPAAESTRSASVSCALQVRPRHCRGSLARAAGGGPSR